MDKFITGLGGDVYPEPPSELHSSITKSVIDSLWQEGLLRAGDKVLDVGCGQGVALEHFRRLGIDATGITLGTDYEVCREKGFDVRELDQNFMDFPEESFDFLWCRHVLEHSIAPLFTLSEYRRLTKPGGLIYIEVPAPDTSAHHESNPNHYSVFPYSLWVNFFGRSRLIVEKTREFNLNLVCGPDSYGAFLLRRPK